MINYKKSMFAQRPLSFEYYGMDIEAGFTQAMEEMDALSHIFAELPKYRSPEVIKDFLHKLLDSDYMSVIKSEA